MKLTIHRGTRQIGGTCVELNSAGGRLFLDMGMPLAVPGDTPFDPTEGVSTHELIRRGVLPPVQDLYAEGERGGVCGLVVSHAHTDHVGLAGYLSKGIPVFATEGAKALLDASRIFLPRSVDPSGWRLLPKSEPIQIGHFTVTASLVDHSAPDAVMLLAEAEGKKVLYSGDLRAHGRKAALFERLIAHPPKDIDCLLLEGTMIGRGQQEHPNERAVEEALVEVLWRKTNLALIFCSSQNLDRLVSIYRAVKRTNTTLVIDLYTAFTLKALRCISKSIPQFDWPNVRVKYWKHHADCLASTGQTDFLYEVRRSKIEIEEIVERRAGITMLAKANRLLPVVLKNLPSTEGLEFLWSMWRGYLTGDHIVSQIAAELGVQPKTIHTSGHATVTDLRRLAEALTPKWIVPIHTMDPDRYLALFNNVRIVGDGEELSL